MTGYVVHLRVDELESWSTVLVDAIQRPKSPNIHDIWKTYADHPRREPASDLALSK